MFRIEWDARLATGVPEIDEQHRELFARFNTLLDACDRGRSRELLGDILEFMGGYVLEHFRTEESLQEQVGYPKLAAHRRVHADLAARFGQLQERYQHHGATVHLVIATCQLLSEVLFEHIERHDKELAAFLIARQAAPPS